VNFEALYGKSDQYVTFSVESDGITSRVVTATYDATDPESSASDPLPGSWYISVPWSASGATSGVASVELWRKKEDLEGNRILQDWSVANLAWNRTGPQNIGGVFYYRLQEAEKYEDGTYYFATRTVDMAGNWEQMPSGDGDTWIYYTAPAGPGSWPDGHTGLEGGGGGCFIATAASD
jgi:hypothetical protein